jgi:hypothetical protein
MTRLRHKGFRQSFTVDKLTGHILVEWVLVWAGVREAVVAGTEDAALAYRVVDAGFDASDPTFLPPELVLWRQNGMFVATVDQLLNQPPRRSHFPSRPAAGLFKAQ